MSTFAKKSFDAVAYAASRPSYPPALYQHVLSYAPPAADGKGLLLDLGCGPGLSTFAFVPLFERVLGLDPSEGMVRAARGVLEQRVEKGEIDLQGGKREARFEQGKGEDLHGIVEDASVDLVVAGQAAHWFDPPKVYSELRRVLKPGGAFAFWGYGEFFFPNLPELNKLIPAYSAGTLGPYWQQPGRSIVESLLTPFPFPSPSSSTSGPDFDPTTFHRSFFLRSGGSPPSLSTPDPPSTTTSVDPLLLTHQWSLKDIEAYLRTWSSASTYKDEHPGEEDVVSAMVERLREGGLKDDEKVEVGWEMGVVMGRLGK
ncbi:S-adenosyl-L-methionine-dependent methyltransferase [Leucosporidium creatinivorum]|uniref:S-adenosyl-L-methionine-dependent methyltransferase n=1 Tax=Leucosporidium creatinivorum TaxID=106004 RepID=A0A1Y2FLE7_9BASI|nr:S-adenosyl-L-methionine-dependent methyltransferase [Leucosporidium creatinivorum]